MFNVVAVSDKTGTAIDRLCHGVEKYMDRIKYSVCDVHPKRPDPNQLNRFLELAKYADVIDYQYFKTADMLRERFPFLKEIPSILTHNNPYSIHDRDWNDYQLVVANNETMLNDLSTITQAPLEYVPLAQDIDFFKYKREFEPNKNVLMVANRIEGKKGILPVAEAVKKLNLRLILVGNISDRNYFEEVMNTKVVEFYENVSDEKLLELYYKSTIHICNSVDNFESGTLPILESMMTGVPVITRTVGHVPDIYNGENMVINHNKPENIEALVHLIETTISDKKLLIEMREKAWNSVKGRNFERRAWKYLSLYRSLAHPKESPVSIIIPVYKDVEQTKKTLDAIARQTYKNIEVIVVNDDPELSQFEVVNRFAETTTFMVKYINSARAENDYGLARARNMGVCEATGEILIFVDQRMVIDEDAVAQFVSRISKGRWLFGDKNGKKNFVENFSAVYKDDFVQMGMFNERVTEYGGMSQEIRSRATLQGIETKLIPEAKAKPAGASKNKFTKKDQIARSKNLLWKLGLE